MRAKLARLVLGYRGIDANTSLHRHFSSDRATAQTPTALIR